MGAGEVSCVANHIENPDTIDDLEIRDNGSGMDQATCERMIVPFFTKKFSGCGVGMATISGITLVVDDEASIRALVRQVIEKPGFTVNFAIDGAEAIQFYKQHQSVGPSHLVSRVSNPHRDERLRSENSNQATRTAYFIPPTYD